MLPITSPAFVFGPEADKMANDKGLEMVKNSYFTTEKKKVVGVPDHDGKARDR